MASPVYEEQKYWDSKVFGNLEFEIWNELAKGYDKNSWDKTADKHADFIMKEFSNCSALLEIGCGIGRLTYRIASNYPVKIIGIDISPAIIKEAKLHENILYIVNDGRTLPVNSSSIDGVFSMVTFQHIETKGFQNYLKEIFRVLRKRGTFYFQFVVGDITSPPCDYQHSIGIVKKWCVDAGLKLQDARDDLTYKEWVWFLGTK